MIKSHSPRFLKLVSEAQATITEITPAMLQQRLAQGDRFYLLDVREAAEWQQGHLPSAQHLSKGILERDIEKIVPNENTPIVLYCSGGFRSVLAAKNLQQMGYQQVVSLQGGATAWQQAGYEMVRD